MKNLHLLIDARCVQEVRTGVGNAAFRHLLGIERLLARGEARGWRVTVVRPARALASAEYRRRWESFSHLHLVAADADPSRHPAGDWWQQVRLPRLAGRLGADIVYSPAFTGPIYTRHAARMVMIHDDMVWSQPSSYPPRFRLYMAAMTRLAARTAQRIVYPSEDARDRCGRLLGIPPRRSAAVHHGIDTVLFHPPDPGTARDPVVLCTASAERRKNQEILVRALKDQRHLTLRLVGFSDRAHRRIEDLRRIDGGGAWTLVPQATEEQVAGELRRAAVLALPSLGEGFGLPVIEAMASGTPLVLSDIPVFREIAGPAALYCDPHDVEAWRRALLDAAGAGTAVRERVAHGFQRVEQFTLEASARQLLMEARTAWESRYRRAGSHQPAR